MTALVQLLSSRCALMVATAALLLAPAGSASAQGQPIVRVDYLALMDDTAGVGHEQEGGTIKVKIVLLGTASDNVTVQWALADDSATAASDYLADSGSITIPKQPVEKWGLAPAVP